MKLAYLSLLFSISFACEAQQKNQNYLQKYSNLMFTKSNGKIVGGGTYFFYKRYGKSFFVTNYHVLTGKDYFNPQSIGHPADAVIINYFTKEGHAAPTDIDITQNAKPLLHCHLN